MISIKTIDQITLMSFIMLFPMFFAYHLGIASGIMSAMLGGYSSAAAMILSPFLITCYVLSMNLQPRSILALDGVFLFFVATIFAFAFGHWVTRSSLEYSWPLLGVCLQFVVLFILFKLLNTDSRTTHIVAITSFLALSIAMIGKYEQAQYGGSLYAYMLDNELAANYQGYAHIYFVVFVLVVAMTRRVGLRALTYPIAFICLFLNGARTELFGAFVVLVLAESAAGKFRAVSAILIGVGILLAVVQYGGTLEEWFPDNRLTGLIEGRTADASLSAREISFEQAVAVILENPVFGSFGQHERGEWAHNALSAWVDMGVVGFALFVGLLFVPLRKLFTKWKKGRAIVQYRFALILLVTEVIFAATAKHYTHQLFPIALGAVAAYFAWERVASARAVYAHESARACLK